MSVEESALWSQFLFENLVVLKGGWTYYTGIIGPRFLELNLIFIKKNLRIFLKMGG